MSIDLSNLTAAPWEPDFDDGSIEGVLCMVPHGNVNTVARCGGETFCHADLAFIALARNEFEIRMRRGWSVERHEDGRRWYVPGLQFSLPPVFADDPYTAVILAEAWMLEQEATHALP